MSTKNTYFLEGPLHLYFDGMDQRPCLSFHNHVVDLPEGWEKALNEYFWHPIMMENLDRFASVMGDDD